MQNNQSNAAKAQASNDSMFLTLTQASIEDKQKAGNDKLAQLNANKAILSNVDSWRAQLEHENKQIEEQLKREEVALKLLDAGGKDEAEKILADYGYVRKSDTPAGNAASKSNDQSKPKAKRKPVKRGSDYIFKYIPKPDANLAKDAKPGYDRLPKGMKNLYNENPLWVKPERKAKATTGAAEKKGAGDPATSKSADDGEGSGEKKS